ncbi:hypothetical protein B0H10DRAFT_2369906, partial [Mycena sp. CBHHK59/15]
LDYNLPDPHGDNTAASDSLDHSWRNGLDLNEVSIISDFLGETPTLKKHQLRGDGITNPLFDMDGIDMHKDTPTEILHTVLLGVVKYYWGQTVWLLEKGKDFALFQTRLNSILADGLNIPKIQADYMCQYKGVSSASISRPSRRSWLLLSKAWFRTRLPRLSRH